MYLEGRVSCRDEYEATIAIRKTFLDREACVVCIVDN